MKDNPSTERNLKEGKLRLPYGRAIGEDSQEALGKGLDGYTMEVLGKWFSVKQDSTGSNSQSFAVPVSQFMGNQSHFCKLNGHICLFINTAVLLL